MGYQQQCVLDATAARAAILNLNARHNRYYSGGERTPWIATFKHTGARLAVNGQVHTDLRTAFDGGRGRLVTLDHDIVVDGVFATQHCIAVLLAESRDAFTTGTYSDELVYERGAWYYATRSLSWEGARRVGSVSA